MMQQLKLTMLPPSDDYDLRIRQEPERARVAGNKEKGKSGRTIDRKPIDPPPVVQLQIRDPTDPAQNYLQSPYYFMCCNLYEAHANRHVQDSIQSPLGGSLVSSLHRLKDVNNTDGGFFVFGDLSVKVEGCYRLRFSLFEMRKDEVVYLKSIVSSSFTVYSAKVFPGMGESTFLSRSFNDQGVRLRIRKEPRTLVKRSATLNIGQQDQQPSYPLQLPQDRRYDLGQPYQPQNASFEPYQASNHATSYGDTSAKRQRKLMDTVPRDSYEKEHQPQLQIYTTQNDPYGPLPFHGQTKPRVGSAYSQGSQSVSSGSSSFTYRNQASDPSSTSSPYVSPHINRPGYSNGSSNPVYQFSAGYTSNSMPRGRYPGAENNSLQQSSYSRDSYGQIEPRYQVQAGNEAFQGSAGAYDGQDPIQYDNTPRQTNYQQAPQYPCPQNFFADSSTVSPHSFQPQTQASRYQSTPNILPPLTGNNTGPNHTRTNSMLAYGNNVMSSTLPRSSLQPPYTSHVRQGNHAADAAQMTDGSAPESHYEPG